MFRNCIWLTLWGYPIAVEFSIFNVCVHVCMHVGATADTHPHQPTSMGWQITKDGIYLELVKIVQFCLKIYVLWRLPNLRVSV